MLCEPDSSVGRLSSTELVGERTISRRGEAASLQSRPAVDYEIEKDVIMVLYVEQTAGSSSTRADTG